MNQLDLISDYVCIDIKNDKPNTLIIDNHCLILNGEDEQVIHSYLSVLDKNPNDVDTIWKLLELYISLYKYNESIPLLNRLEILTSTNENVFHLLGNVYFNLKFFEKAIIAYNKVMDLKVYCWEIFNHIGTAYAELKKFEKSIEILKKGIEQFPKEKELYITITNVCYENSQFEESLYYYQLLKKLL